MFGYFYKRVLPTSRIPHSFVPGSLQPSKYFGFLCKGGNNSLSNGPERDRRSAGISKGKEGN